MDENPVEKWYSFTARGIGFIPAVFAVMLRATWLFAIVLRALSRRFARYITGGRFRVRDRQL